MGTLSLAQQSPSQSDWTLMKEQAKTLLGTGFLPDAIKTPEQAVAVMLKGREIGVPTMYALSNIVVIKGKPTASAELMLALIYRDHGDNAVIVEHSDATRCSLTYKRRTQAARHSFSFTIADAERAGLASEPTWKKYPAAMLRARAISATARMAFPDSIGGMYLPEEMGATVRVMESGETIIDAPSNGHESEIEAIPGAQTLSVETVEQRALPPVSVIAHKPPRTRSQDLDRRLNALIYKAQGLHIPLPPLPANATDDEKTDYGMALASKVALAESRIPEPVN